MLHFASLLTIPGSYFKSATAQALFEQGWSFVAIAIAPLLQSHNPA
jgi:hypothetical protein